MRIFGLILITALFCAISYADENILYPQTIDATSYLYENAGMIYSPLKLYDQDEHTSYAEAVTDEGIGSKIVFNYNGIVEIDKVRIINGFREKDEYFSYNNRVKKIKIEVFNGARSAADFSLEIKDIRDPQLFTLKKKYKGNKIVMEIEEVYKGSKYNDTCISEITFYGSAENKAILNESNLQKNEYGNAIEKYMLLQNKTMAYYTGHQYAAVIRFKGNKALVSYSHMMDGLFYYVHVYRYSICGNELRLYPLEYMRSIYMKERYNDGFYEDDRMTKQEAEKSAHWPKVVWTGNPFDMPIAQMVELNKEKMTLKFKTVDSVFMEMFREIHQVNKESGLVKTDFNEDYIYNNVWEYKIFQ
jgi:hypothetical protein